VLVDDDGDHDALDVDVDEPVGVLEDEDAGLVVPVPLWVGGWEGVGKRLLVIVADWLCDGDWNGEGGTEELDVCDAEPVVLAVPDDVGVAAAVALPVNVGLAVGELLAESVCVDVGEELGVEICEPLCDCVRETERVYDVLMDCDWDAVKLGVVVLDGERVGVWLGVAVKLGERDWLSLLAWDGDVLVVLDALGVMVSDGLCDCVRVDDRV
jgi:hypothetical protein